MGGGGGGVYLINKSALSFKETEWKGLKIHFLGYKLHIILFVPVMMLPVFLRQADLNI